MMTLEQHLREAQTPKALMRLLLQIASICADISGQIRQGALADIHGEAGTDNAQGEQQKKLDIIANDYFVRLLAKSKSVCGLASEEMDHAVNVPGGARLLVAFDPLDGSSNIDINSSIGSIFSILPAPCEIRDIADEDFLVPGKQQLASGYVIYGPATELVFTVDDDVNGFSLDSRSSTWIKTRGPLAIPEETREFAINSSNGRHWYPDVRDYIDMLLAGTSGPRGKEFNMRWVGSMVAEVHRILCRGGVFLYPSDQREALQRGKLRLLYEANPMSLLIIRAGGFAKSEASNILDITPRSIHEKTSIALGSANEGTWIWSHKQEREIFRD